MKLSREQLHAEIWARPLAEVAKEYGVTQSVVLQACERLKIPRPPRGYWASLKTGHPLPTRPLPPAEPGDEKEWSPHIADSAQTTERAATLRTRRHSLLFGAEEELVAGRPMKEGYLRPNPQLFPDIFVSREQLKRALSLASTLYNELEARGHDVRIASKDSGLRCCGLDHRVDLRPRTMEHFGPSYPVVQFWRPQRPTVVFVGEVAIALTVYELSEYVSVHDDWRAKRYVSKPDGYQRRDMPCGRLAIQIGSPYRHTTWSKTWNEEERGDLLAQLPTIVEVIIRAAPDVARLASDGIRQHAKWERERDEMLLAEEGARIEAAAKAEAAASRRNLEQLIATWHQDRTLGAFIDAAAREVALLEPDERVVAEEQLARARNTLAPMRAVEVLRVWSQSTSPNVNTRLPR